MIYWNVIRLRSKHKRCLVSVILIVIFTSRMNAHQIMRDFIIMYSRKIFERPSMTTTLESGVLFVVREVEERMIMPALTLLEYHATLAQEKI